MFFSPHKNQQTAGCTSAQTQWMLYNPVWQSHCRTVDNRAVVLMWDWLKPGCKYVIALLHHVSFIIERENVEQLLTSGRVSWLSGSYWSMDTLCGGLVNLKWGVEVIKCEFNHNWSLIHDINKKSFIKHLLHMTVDCWSNKKLFEELWPLKTVLCRKKNDFRNSMI